MAKRKTKRDAAEAGIEEAIDSLYLGDFEGFIGRRDDLAKQLRGEGDSEAAARVRALKKPSRGAWAVNQLSGRESALRDELLKAGTALRNAHERVLTGDADHAELREASEAERAAVAQAFNAVSALAEEADARLSPAAAEKVRQTLHAVALDETVREEFGRGRLTTEHEAAGVGGSFAGPAVPTKTRPKKTSPKNREREEAKRRRAELKVAEAELVQLERRRNEAERDVEAAREAAERAQRDLKRATGELEKAENSAAAAKSRVEDLR